MYIYKITNLINDKAYVGQTFRPDPSIRWLEHKSHKESLIGKAIKKYGEEAFSFEIIDTCESIEELNRKEIEYINKLNTMKPNGYNLFEGGWNRKLSIEARRKISWARKGIKTARAIPVVGISIDDGTAWYFRSSYEAEKFGFKATKITACCKGRRKLHGRHTWAYFKAPGGVPSAF